jgi:hypothetical protein
MIETTLDVYVEFANAGCVKAIHLYAENEGNQIIVEMALDRLLNPQHSRWIKRFFKKG